MDIQATLTEELQLKAWQTEAVIRLLDEGNTVPFIARYRKEATGSMDDGQLRRFFERLTYLRGVEEKKEQALRSIEEQGKLTEKLREKFAEAKTLVAVEDLYRPYRPKRKTRAGLAREKGYEPFAKQLAQQLSPREAAADMREKGIAFAGDTPTEEAYLYGLAEYYVNLIAQQEEARHGVQDTENNTGNTDAPASGNDTAGTNGEDTSASAQDAIQGAKDILAEDISDDAEIRAFLRSLSFAEGKLVSRRIKEAEETQRGKTDVYEMYYEYEEAAVKIPGHRVLALNRGEKEKILRVSLDMPREKSLDALEEKCLRHTALTKTVIRESYTDAYDRLLSPSIERDIRRELTERAEDGAISVFGKNLEQLLMQPPIPDKVVMGWDPAFRTGCKLAVVDGTGKVLDTKVIFPTAPQNKTEEAKKDCKRLIETYGVELISVGNGTASRESETVIADMIREEGLSVKYAIVSEAGASVYSASKLAAEEFPQLDVGARSAVSIARRLQDPLAELVKIDPKAIGVGQYQHDMDQKKLEEALSTVVEDCVNRVGVDVNTASASLLSYISGISAAVAENIVKYREAHGKFKSRQELKQVEKLGPKAFEQCAGFLRIHGGDEPLDDTAVHPEAYDAAKKILQKGEPAEIKKKLVYKKQLKELAEELHIGEITLNDILKELVKPSRDPRTEAPAPVLRKDVLSLEDLREGMRLKGTVRNVMDFGAFVDIGVHQDGLVHISQMSKKFIRHPLDVVKIGDVVEVEILSVDVKKQRIALTMKLE